MLHMFACMRSSRVSTPWICTCLRPKTSVPTSRSLPLHFKAHSIKKTDQRDDKWCLVCLCCYLSASVYMPFSVGCFWGSQCVSQHCHQRVNIFAREYNDNPTVYGGCNPQMIGHCFHTFLSSWTTNVRQSFRCHWGCTELIIIICYFNIILAERVSKHLTC